MGVQTHTPRCVVLKLNGAVQDMLVMRLAVLVSEGWWAGQLGEHMRSMPKSACCMRR